MTVVGIVSPGAMGSAVVASIAAADARIGATPLGSSPTSAVEDILDRLRARRDESL